MFDLLNKAGGTVINKIYNTNDNKQFRKNLRNNQTKEERNLWNILRKRQLNDLRFHRQYGIGNYIADFYCPEIKLVIELDGSGHYDKNQHAYDLQRESYMKSLNIKTLRFSNLEILQQIDGVYETIKQCANELLLPTPPTPSLTKEGD